MSTAAREFTIRTEIPGDDVKIEEPIIIHRYMVKKGTRARLGDVALCGHVKKIPTIPGRMYKANCVVCLDIWENMIHAR